MLFVHVGGVSIPPALLSRYHHSHTASIHRSTINPLAPTTAPCNNAAPSINLISALSVRTRGGSNFRFGTVWDTCVSFETLETPLGHMCLIWDTLGTLWDTSWDTCLNDRQNFTNRVTHEWVITESHHHGIFTVHRWPFLTFAQHGSVKNPNDILRA